MDNEGKMIIQHVTLNKDSDMIEIRKKFLKSDADALFLQADYVILPDKAVEKLAIQIQGNIKCVSGWVPASETVGWNAITLVADNTIAHIIDVIPSITMADYTSPECILISREIIEKIPFNFKTGKQLKWVTGYKIITDPFMNFCNDIYENGYAIYMDGDIICDRIFPPPIPDIEDPPVENKNDKIVLMFAIDNKYVRPLAVAIKSILNYFPKNRELEIIVGNVNISQENKNKLNEIYPIRFVNVDISRVKNIKINIVYHSSAIFARLLMPEILKNIDKALYMDCDIIVQDDITRLWDMDISNHVLAAAQDYTILERDGYIYFNSGILLMNFDLWRKKKVSKKAIKYVSKNITNFTDQDAMNHILKGDYLRISKKWNTNPISGEIDGLKIIHFLGSEKPWWYKSKMKITPLWFKILDTTPFKGWRPEILKKEIIIKRGVENGIQHKAS